MKNLFSHRAIRSIAIVGAGVLIYKVSGGFPPAVLVTLLQTAMYGGASSGLNQFSLSSPIVLQIVQLWGLVFAWGIILWFAVGELMQLLFPRQTPRKDALLSLSQGTALLDKNVGLIEDEQEEPLAVKTLAVNALDEDEPRAPVERRKRKGADMAPVLVHNYPTYPIPLSARPGNTFELSLPSASVPEERAWEEDLPPMRKSEEEAWKDNLPSIRESEEQVWEEDLPPIRELEERAWEEDLPLIREPEEQSWEEDLPSIREPEEQAWKEEQLSAPEQQSACESGQRLLPAGEPEDDPWETEEPPVARERPGDSSQEWPCLIEDVADLPTLVHQPIVKACEVRASTKQLVDTTPRIHAVSHTGIVRASKPNEDSYWQMSLSRQTLQGETQWLGLFLVADGMGGHSHGKYASSRAIEVIRAHIGPALCDPGKTSADFKELFVESVRQANARLYQENQELGDFRGTTVTGALIVEETRSGETRLFADDASSTHYIAHIVNVGDSRTYRYSPPDSFYRVTRDHSAVERLIEEGALTPEERYTDKRRNEIYRCLGNTPEVEVDVFTVALRPCDRLLLCSDGLWEMVRENDLASLFSTTTDDPEHLTTLLLRSALAGGGRDNITALVVMLPEWASVQTEKSPALTAARC